MSKEYTKVYKIAEYKDFRIVFDSITGLSKASRKKIFEAFIDLTGKVVSWEEILSVADEATSWSGHERVVYGRQKGDIYCSLTALSLMKPIIGAIKVRSYEMARKRLGEVDCLSPEAIEIILHHFKPLMDLEVPNPNIFYAGMDSIRDVNSQGFQMRCSYRVIMKALCEGDDRGLACIDPYSYGDYRKDG